MKDIATRFFPHHFRRCSSVGTPQMRGMVRSSMYYTYILKSLKDGRRYIGFSDNLSTRLYFHNAGLNPSTKNRRPLELLCCKKFVKKIDAMRYEKYLKKLKGGRQLKTEIEKMKQNMPL